MYYVVKRIGKYEYLYEQVSYRVVGEKNPRTKGRSLGRVARFFRDLGPIFPTPTDRAEDMVLDKIAKDREAAAAKQEKAEEAKAGTKSHQATSQPEPTLSPPTGVQSSPSSAEPDAAPTDAGPQGEQSGNDGPSSAS